MRYVVVFQNLIENMIEWDGSGSWSPPGGRQLFQTDIMCGIGWTWNNGAPVDPNPPVIVPPPTIDLSNIDNLDRVLRAIGLMTGRWASKTPAQIKANFLTAYQDLNGG